MQKDFDKWNELKKFTDNRSENFGANEREIWWMSLGVNIGVEIDGKNEYFDRPAVVLRKFNREMVWVLPTTKQVKNERFHQEFLFDGETYFVALTQIRTVSTKRLLRKVGMISQEDFAKINARVIAFLRKNEDPPFSGSSRRPKP